MRPKRAPLLTSLFALSLSALAATPAREARGAASNAATLSDGEGCIKIDEGACNTVEIGATLTAQGTFVAGKRGATLSFSDQSTAQLSEGTEIKLQPRTKMQINAKESVSATVVQATRGKLIVSLPTQGKAAVMVKAPNNMTGVVKTGSALVKVLDDGLAVGTLNGSALVASGNDWNDVLEGKLRVVRKSDPKGVVRSLIAAPRLLPVKGMQLVIGAGQSSPIKLGWQPVADAAAYEVELRPISGGAGTVKRFPREAREASFDALAAGSYVAQVRAIDEEALESPWSPPAKLSIVGVALPPGAVVVGGVIQLPEKQKVKLLNTEGLESSYNDIADFVTPPAELGLLTGKAQLFRLRRKGETEELQIRFEPRSVIAQVELTPRTARWPGDPVTISIKLTSADGQPVVGDVQLMPKVTLDLQPLTLDWTKTPGSMRATVAPHADGRPHALRVEVADQYGFFLGRGNLEIAPANESKKR